MQLLLFYTITSSSWLPPGFKQSDSLFFHFITGLDIKGIQQNTKKVCIVLPLDKKNTSTLWC